MDAGDQIQGVHRQTLRAFQFPISYYVKTTLTTWFTWDWKKLLADSDTVPEISLGKKPKEKFF